uniref:Uncharacterized protein n=1 Tax=Anguilla anguilla TaxID=7936 RepID=A0A0E9PC36_ANGAN
MCLSFLCVFKLNEQKNVAVNIALF